MHTGKGHFDVAVVGAGAAGQMAAIAAARNSASVVLLEQMSKPGMKILASGGGRCNLTNLSPLEKYETLFGTHGRFIRHAMQNFQPPELRNFFSELGVPTKTDETRLRVFPFSDKAIHVQAALRKEIERLAATVLTAQEVTELVINDGIITALHSKRGENISCGAAVLTCGGKTWAELGGTGGGYRLAQQAGHNIEPLSPALAPLVIEGNSTARLAGVAIENAIISLPADGRKKKNSCGDIIFTHRGISGPAVLDISGDVSQLLQKQQSVAIHIELVAGTGENQWQQKFDSWRSSSGKRKIVNLLSEILPASLCRYIAGRADINDDTTAAQLSAESRKKLIESLCRFELKIISTEGFKTAFVTRGGVRLKEVDPKTMQSRCVKNLFLAGEMLDLDGPTGGFNLQWAFASGRLAGESAAKFVGSASE